MITLLGVEIRRCLARRLVRWLVVVALLGCALAGFIAWLSLAGLVVEMGFRSGPCTMLTTYGSITAPSLAMPAVTMAICSGLAATSYWPMALSASWA